MHRVKWMSFPFSEPGYNLWLIATGNGFDLSRVYPNSVGADMFHALTSRSVSKKWDLMSNLFALNLLGSNKILFCLRCAIKDTEVQLYFF